MAHGLTGRELVDAHMHLWDLELTPQPWIDPAAMQAIARDFRGAELIAELASATPDAASVTSAVVVQADHSLDETRWLLGEAADTSEVRSVIGWVDLTADVPAQLAALAEHPEHPALAGIRHLAHVDRDGEWLLRDDVATGVQALAGHGLAFDLVVRAGQLDQAAALAARVPDARFVLDHLGNPPLVVDEHSQWARALAELSSRENVTAKISGLVSSADPRHASPDHLERVVETALGAFGASRLMFGSDWPLVLLSPGGYAGWLDAYLRLTSELSDGERRAIDAGTARVVYRIAA